MGESWAGLLLLLWLCVSAVCDALFRKIYNYIVLFGVFFYIVLYSFNYWLTTDLWSALGGAFLAFVGFLFFYKLNLMGAGDVKFGAVLGLFLGWSLLLPVWTISCLFAVCHGIYEKGFKGSVNFINGVNFGGLKKNKEKSIPYVTYLSLATVIVLMLSK